MSYHGSGKCRSQTLLHLFNLWASFLLFKDQNDEVNEEEIKHFHMAVFLVAKKLSPCLNDNSLATKRPTEIEKNQEMKPKNSEI